VITEVWRGASKVWEGRLSEPNPVGSGGFELTAKGAGTYGDRYRSIWGTWNQNDPLDQAIARGLRWSKPTFASTGLYLSEPQDSLSQSITEFLNLITKPGAYTWHLGPRNRLAIFPVPTAPTRVLMSGSPAARSLADYINVLYGRYQSAADNATTGALATFGLATATNAASVAKHDRNEANWDLAPAGTLSGGTAGALVTSALSQYQAVSWSGPLTVSYGQYLTLSGVPVDLACEKAGEVVLLLLADGPYGGEVSPSPPVTFPVGRVEYDAAAEALAVSPFLTVPGDFSALLDSLTAALPKPAVTDG
jgi:hypothetical protein